MTDTSIQIPGPGSAMALAAGAAVVIAGYGTSLTDFIRVLLIVIGLVFAFLAVYIERMHTQKELKIAKLANRVPKSNGKRRVP